MKNTMKNTLALLSISTCMALVGNAFADEETASGSSKVKYKDNGGYEATSTSKQTDVSGGARTSSTDVDVDVDKSGKVTKTTKVKTTNDAKGLMNKKTNTTETKMKQKDNGGYESTVSHNHTDNAGTNTSDKTTADVTVDSNGNVTKTVKTKTKVDPKGLGNSKTTAETTKSVNGHVVDQTENGNNTTDTNTQQ